MLQKNEPLTYDHADCDSEQLLTKKQSSAGFSKRLQ